MPRGGTAFVCSDLRVRDLARSVRFYARLGLRPVESGRMGDGTSITWMRESATGQMLELFELSRRSPLYTPYRTPIASHSARIFGVRDVARVVRGLRALGGRVTSDFEDGSVRLTFLTDPDGFRVELLSWVEPARRRNEPPPLVALARNGPRSS
jgi:catechol 2,3-dioxygenase-like lactoylglutathione lyase family enzyme